MPNWKKLIVSGSDANLNSLQVTQNISATSITASAFSGSFEGTASIANKVTGGTEKYIPLWSSTSTLSSSILYQTQSGILLGSTTHHTPEAPDKLGVYAGVTDSYNLISGHGEIDNYFQVNIKNFSGGSSASADIVVTSDIGTETSGYADFGINSSGYLNNGNGIGSASDAYLYAQDAGDLLIGNKSPDKRVVIFTGEGDAINNARVYIDPSGSVAINTSTTTVGNPEALVVAAIANSYNLISARANYDNYTQLNIINLSGGNSASADIVATNNIGNETSYYIDMGINSDQYNQPGFVGGPNDAYIYSTGNMLHIGNASANQHVMFFAGGVDAEANNKLTLDANNNHSLSGSLNVTGSINVLDNVVNNLTASFAVTASYVQGAASDWNTLSNKPDGIVSSSTQVQNYNVFATTGSNVFKASQTITGSLIVTDTITAQQFNIELISSSVIYESGSTKFGDSADDTHQFTGSLSVLGTISGSLVLPNGVVSSSTQAANWTVLSASFATTASAATSITFTPATASFATTSSAATSITFTPSSASFATTSSFASNARLLNNTGSGVFATTGSNSFNGTQTITGSLLLTTDIVVFSGSFTTSGSFAITGSLGVTNGITGSLLGSSSFATTASAATSITFTPTSSSFATTASAANSITFTPASASFATTASFAQNARLLNNTGSAVFATTGSNTFNGTQTITGSLLLASDTVIFTGSFTTSGSFTVSGSLGVSGGITGSLLGSSSFATTASAATSITFTPTSASFATTASAANSITFIPSSASFATTASAATSITFTPTSASFATTSSYAVTSSLAISASFIDGGFY